mgnify:CR=1 FL=1
MKRIVIGVPSHGDWKAAFGISLSQMCMATLKHGDKEVSVVGSMGSMLSKQRHDLVVAARAQDATHLLFLDSDIIFPDDTLDQLLFWDKPVVGAAYPTKTIPSMPTVRKWSQARERWEFVFTNKKSEDLEQVDRLPTGCLLIEMGVFEQIKQPWFEFAWTGEEDLYQGEDWGLCERIEEAGIEMYLDHNVTKEVGHIGNFVFKNAHVKPDYIQYPKDKKSFRTFKDRGVVR